MDRWIVCLGSEIYAFEKNNNDKYENKMKLEGISICGICKTCALRGKS